MGHYWHRKYDKQLLELAHWQYSRKDKYQETFDKYIKPFLKISPEQLTVQLSVCGGYIIANT